jgi:iron complex transport system substrate-binding protein
VAPGVEIHESASGGCGERRNRSAPQKLAEVFASIEQVAAAAGVEAVGRTVVEELTQRVAAVARRAANRPHRRVAFLEWLDPPFSSGHWTPELIELAGGVDCLGTAGARSRTVHVDEILAARPEIVFIACCGYSAARAREDLPRLAATPGWTDLPAARGGEIYVADGSQYFNRPGPRLVDSLELLAHALDPPAHPLPPYIEPATRIA